MYLLQLHRFTWVVRQSDVPSRFAITRLGTPLMGAFVPLAHDYAVLDNAKSFGISQDMDLELLWAGWRALLWVTGRDDEVSPSDVLAWCRDWYVELSMIGDNDHRHT
jgi:hypothetical protein